MMTLPTYLTLYKLFKWIWLLYSDGSAYKTPWQSTEAPVVPRSTWPHLGLNIVQYKHPVEKILSENNGGSIVGVKFLLENYFELHTLE
jgi:hypothetical protein